MKALSKISAVTGRVCDMQRRKRNSHTAWVPVSCWTQMISQNVSIRAGHSVTVIVQDYFIIILEQK